MVSGRNATLEVAVVGDVKDALRALSDVGGGVGGLASKLASAGVAFAALGAAAGAALAGVGAVSVKTFANLGDSLLEASQRTGLSVEALSQLKFAADQSGASIEGLEGSVAKMQKSLYATAQGGEGDAFKALGVSLEALRGMNVEEQFSALAGALAEVKNDTDRAALAMAVFGKSGTDLLPMLADGASGLQAMKDEARRLGVVLSTEDAKAGDAFNDALGSLKAGLEGVQIAIGRGLTPLLTELASLLRDHVANAQATVTAKVAEFGSWWTTNGPAIVAAIQNVVSVAADMARSFLAGLDAISPLFAFIVDNKPVLIAAVVAIGIAIALAFGPAGVAIAAIGALILAIGYLRDHWREVGNAIIGFTENWANGIVKGINFVADKIGDFLELVLRPYISMVNKIPGVNIEMPQIMEGGILGSVELPRIPRGQVEGSPDAEAFAAARGEVIKDARAAVRDTVTPMLGEATALHKASAEARVAADTETISSQKALAEASIAAANAVMRHAEAAAQAAQQLQQAGLSHFGQLNQQGVTGYAPTTFETIADFYGLHTNFPSSSPMDVVIP